MIKTQIRADIPAVDAEHELMATIVNRKLAESYARSHQLADYLGPDYQVVIDEDVQPPGREPGYIDYNIKVTTKGRLAKQSVVTAAWDAIKQKYLPTEIELISPHRQLNVSAFDQVPADYFKSIFGLVCDLCRTPLFKIDEENYTISYILEDGPTAIVDYEEMLTLITQVVLEWYIIGVHYYTEFDMGNDNSRNLPIESMPDSLVQLESSTDYKTIKTEVTRYLATSWHRIYSELIQKGTSRVYFNVGVCSDQQLDTISAYLKGTVVTNGYFDVTITDIAELDKYFDVFKLLGTHVDEPLDTE